MGPPGGGSAIIARMPAPKLLVESRGAVTVVTLNRPDVHNAVDAETADLLTGAIEGFAAGEERVMVVTGAGDRAFCAGADLKAVEGLMRRPDVSRTGPLGFSGLEPGKPTIAAIEGYCMGGGIELALWCDFRVAGEGAVFGALNRRVGVPWVDGGTQRLPQAVGVANALYLMETAERIDAQRALRIGLVQEVVGHGRALDRALELADRISGWPQVSLRADREATRASWGRTLEEGLSYEGKVGQAAAEHDELAEGAKRFTQRSQGE
jgi:enoyl-CoA hydratase